MSCNIYPRKTLTYIFILIGRIWIVNSNSLKMLKNVYIEKILEEQEACCTGTTDYRKEILLK